MSQLECDHAAVFMVIHNDRNPDAISDQTHMSSFPLNHRKRFARVVSVPEKEIDLSLTSVLIAVEDDPNTDVIRTMGKIALLRDRVRGKLTRYRTAYDVLHAVNEVMFEEEQLTGNRRNYYDPQNSLLPAVLSRKLGIPITLSIIYRDLASVGGQLLECVGLPHHFILRAGHGKSQIYVDPFDRGGLLSRSECINMIVSNKRNLINPEHYLIPLANGAVLRRLLTNLKYAYIRAKDLPRALRAAERIQIVKPSAWHNLGDMVRIHSSMGNIDAATDSLMQYLENAPANEDTTGAFAALNRLRDKLGKSSPNGM